MIGIIIITLLALIFGIILVNLEKMFYKDTSEVETLLPGYNCGACGYKGCSDLAEKIFMILDGDMKTDYIFDEGALSKHQLEDPKYLAQCVKKAFDMELDVYPDGGERGKRVDQQCEEYLKYLRYYKSN